MDLAVISETVELSKCELCKVKCVVAQKSIFFFAVKEYGIRLLGNMNLSFR